MTTNWVDFKAIKQAVTIEQVLAHYQVNWLRKEREELVGRCPIHQGEGERAFHASLAKNAFKCFSCKAHGNVLDFVAAMEKSSVRDAALKIAEWFSISVPEQLGREKMPAKKAELEEPPARTGGG